MDENDATAGVGETRRSILKKAAVAPLVAGATWVAPRVEGLSLVPDIAAAQSGAAVNRFTLIEGDTNSFATSPAGGVTVNANAGGDSLLLTRNAGDCTFGTVNAANQGDADPAFIGTHTPFGDSLSVEIGSMLGNDNDRFNVPLEVTFDMTCT